MLGALTTAALVIFGILTTPHFFQAGASSWTGVAAALGVLLAYAAGGSRLAGTTASRMALPWALPLGLAAGAVYASEIGFEHAFLPQDNTGWGLIEFGAVFALCLMSGVLVAAEQRRVWPGALAGAWTAMIGSLIWYAALLAVTYAFQGSEAQAAIFRAEGDVEDFRRSGMSDFNVFMMQDFLGAGFFHLLLAPLAGLLLGSLGAIPAALVQRWRKSPAKSAG